MSLRKTVFQALLYFADELRYRPYFTTRTARSGCKAENSQQKQKSDTLFLISQSRLLPYRRKPQSWQELSLHMRILLPKSSIAAQIVGTSCDKDGFQIRSCHHSFFSRWTLVSAFIGTASDRLVCVWENYWLYQMNLASSCLIHIVRIRRLILQYSLKRKSFTVVLEHALLTDPVFSFDLICGPAFSPGLVICIYHTVATYVCT